jgi:hypothetical protein
MNFAIVDRFTATMAEMEGVLNSADFHARRAEAMPGLRSIEPLERVEDDATIRRRVRYVPNTDGKIPAFGKLVTPAMLTWVEESTWDKARHRFDYRILPNLPAAWRDRFTSNGSYQLSQEGGELVRRIDGEILVRVPLFGGVVEKLLVREVTQNFRAEAAAMSAMLRAARAV